MIKRPESELGYPAYLRKIGEHQIAEYIEGLQTEVYAKERKPIKMNHPQRIRIFTSFPWEDTSIEYLFNEYLGKHPSYRATHTQYCPSVNGSAEKLFCIFFDTEEDDENRDSED